LGIPQAEALPSPQFQLLEQANTGGPSISTAIPRFYAYYNFSQRCCGRQAQPGGEIAKAQPSGRRIRRLELSWCRSSSWPITADGAAGQLHFMEQDLQRLEQIKAIAKVRYATTPRLCRIPQRPGRVGTAERSLCPGKAAPDAREQLNALLGRPSQTPAADKDRDDSRDLPAQALQLLIELRRNQPGHRRRASSRRGGDRVWPWRINRLARLPDQRRQLRRFPRWCSCRPCACIPWCQLQPFLPAGLCQGKAGLGQAQAQLEAARPGSSQSAAGRSGRGQRLPRPGDRAAQLAIREQLLAAGADGYRCTERYASKAPPMAAPGSPICSRGRAACATPS